MYIYASHFLLVVSLSSGRFPKKIIGVWWSSLQPAIPSEFLPLEWWAATLNSPGATPAFQALMDKLNGAVRSHGKTEVARILAEVPRGSKGPLGWLETIWYEWYEPHLSLYNLYIILYHSASLYHSVIFCIYVCVSTVPMYLSVSISIFIYRYSSLSLSLSDGKQWPIAEEIIPANEPTHRWATGFRHRAEEATLRPAQKRCAARAAQCAVMVRQRFGPRI